ncbi:MAG: ATP-binding protein [Candidatus Paceibacterota bacterium]
MEENNKEMNTLDDQGLEPHKFSDELDYFIPLAFCQVDTSNSIVFCSQVFRELTKYQEKEVLGFPIFSFFKDGDKLKGIINWSQRERTVKEEYLILNTKDEKEIHVKVSVGTIFDKKGNLTGYFLTAVEMTDRKNFEEELEKKIKERTKEIEKAKEKLRESEKVLEIRVNARTRQLRELAETLKEKARKRTEALEKKTNELQKKAKSEERSRKALLNLAEDLEEASQKAQEEKEKTLAIVNNLVDGLFFFDRNRRLVLINPQGEKIFNIRSDDVLEKRPCEMKKFNKRLEMLMNLIGEEAEEMFREEMTLGDKVFMEVTSIPVRRNERVIGTLIIVHDVTREKNVERMKTEFVSLAAHQLRTPLAGIKWALRTAMEEKGNEGSETEIAELIEKAYDANERMVNLVNDLLNVTRIEEGRYVYEPKKIEIKEVIENVLEEYKELVESKGLELRLEEPEESLPMIKADPEELSLVVKNFFDNALKYTKEGGVTLKAESIEDENKIKLSVSDTGIGIPEDQRDKMFNKFFRAENVRLMETEGTGLGLFISKNIIEAHGGEIGFDSEEGKGSTFFFTIPTIKSGQSGVKE